MTSHFRLALAAWILIVGSVVSAEANSGPISLKAYLEKPNLVVVVVIDQLRGDFLPRMASEFAPAQSGQGGFRLLMENGAYYPHGSFEAMQPMTCPGHATVLSGAHPSNSGIPLNAWWDWDKQQHVYCAEDRKNQLVRSGPSAEKYKDDEKTRSPRLHLSGTLPDVVKLAGGKFKTVSVALKDRAAIMMGGYQADAVYWFDSNASEWISSRYYLPSGKLPEWVSRHNKQTARFQGTSVASRLGLRITTDFATRCIDEHSLGKHKDPDFLFVSYSSTDKVGHKYGPESAEYRQILLDTDAELGKLFETLRHKVPGGLAKTWIVLTSDHGVGPNAKYALKFRDPEYIQTEKELAREINQFLDKRYGELNGQHWLVYANQLNFWLNPQALEQKRLKRSDVEQAVKAHLIARPEINHVITATDVANGRIPSGRMGKLISQQYIPGKSGHIVVFFRPFTLPTTKHAATHLSPYSYDRHIPIVFMGKPFRKGVYGQQAELVDVAPTLSFLLGHITPPLSDGRVLHEAIGNP